jgi:uncharacterized membrane protein (DUF373 family)
MINTARWAGLRIDDIQAEYFPPEFFPDKSMKSSEHNKKKTCDPKEKFLKIVSRIVSVISALLAVVMVGVIIFISVDLVRFIINDIFAYPAFSFSTSLLEIFGLFLNVLIAFEILENITSYIKKNHLQIELVVATSLTAVARKLIVFDFEKAGGLELIGLSIAIAALSGSYIFLRRTGKK